MGKKCVSIISILTAIAIAFILTNILETKTLGQANQRTDSDTQLLARCVNGEARGEPYIGQVAVAAVILNRSSTLLFPIHSRRNISAQAFTAVSDGQINRPLTQIPKYIRHVRTQ